MIPDLKGIKELFDAMDKYKWSGMAFRVAVLLLMLSVCGWLLSDVLIALIQH